MQVLQLDRARRPTSSGCARTRRRSTLLFRDLLIGVTNFFRDAEAFEALERQVIPKLFEGKERERHGPGLGARAAPPARRCTRSPSCCASTWTSCGAPPKVQIFATDIDDAALAVARAGALPGQRLLDGVSPGAAGALLHARTAAATVLAKEVRDLCIFSAHSVIRDPPFSRIDLSPAATC